MQSKTRDAKFIRKSCELAKRWMVGLRQGPTLRFSWQHPEDLVTLLTDLGNGGLRDMLSDQAFFDRVVDIAWLHDLIEDGLKEDTTSQVTVADLAEFSPEVIGAVVHLTQLRLEAKLEYLARMRDGARLKALGLDVVLVKLVDRICNLREGSAVYEDARWARVIDETSQYILPMCQALPLAEGAVLRHLLLSAMDARKVVV